MFACVNGHIEIIKYLIENKTCPFPVTNILDKDDVSKIIN